MKLLLEVREQEHVWTCQHKEGFLRSRSTDREVKYGIVNAKGCIGGELQDATNGRAPVNEETAQICIGQQRGSLREWVWHGSVGEAKVCWWVPPYRKNGTQWHSWRPNSGCGHSEVGGGVFQQWQQQQGRQALSWAAMWNFISMAYRLLVIAGVNDSWWWWLYWE